MGNAEATSRPGATASASAVIASTVALASVLFVVDPASTNLNTAQAQGDNQDPRARLRQERRRIRLDHLPRGHVREPLRVIDDPIED